MMRRRAVRLDAEGQAIVAQAWPWAEMAIRKAERVYPGPDYHGYVAVRLCRQAPRFNPERVSLKAWAFANTFKAIADAQRAHVVCGYRRDRRKAREALPRIMSMDAYPILTASLVREDRGVDSRAIEMADRLINTLDPRERAIVRGVVMEGRSQVEVGREIGVSDCWVSRIRRRALSRLRDQFNAM